MSTRDQRHASTPRADSSRARVGLCYPGRVCAHLLFNVGAVFWLLAMAVYSQNSMSSPFGICFDFPPLLYLSPQVALLSPFVQREVLRFGHGVSETKPIVLPKQARGAEGPGGVHSGKVFFVFFVVVVFPIKNKQK